MGLALSRLLGCQRNTAFVGWKRRAGDSHLLYVLRLVFGSAMVACLVLGVHRVSAPRHRRHRAWMIRAYAIGLTAGTQAFTEGGAVFGAGELHGDLAKGAGWVINLAVAEWVICRKPPGRRKRAARSRISADFRAGGSAQWGHGDWVGSDRQLGAEAAGSGQFLHPTGDHGFVLYAVNRSWQQAGLR